MLVGLGNGAFYPAFTPVLAGLLKPDERKRPSRAGISR